MQSAFREMKMEKRRSGWHAGGRLYMVRIGAPTPTFQFLTETWRQATTAEDGHESDQWAKAWKEGAVVPLLEAQKKVEG